MPSRISDLLDSLPEDLRPVASGLIDAVAAGFLDNGEAIVGRIINGEPGAAAFQAGLNRLSTKGLVDLLKVTNAKLESMSQDHRDIERTHKFLISQLIILAFSLLRKEVIELHGQ